MTRPLALLATLAACNGGLGGPRECPYEEIAPTEVCNFQSRTQVVCATCDPSECSNCPEVWECIGEGTWGSKYGGECACIDPDGYYIQDSGNCRPDS